MDEDKKRNRKKGRGDEQLQRGDSSRPGLLPARTRHDVRRGRGRPPQPVVVVVGGLGGVSWLNRWGVMGGAQPAAQPSTGDSGSDPPSAPGG